MEIEPDADSDVAVFLGCDTAFLPHALVTITSLMENSRPGTSYDIVVLTDKVEQGLLDAAVAWFKRYPASSLRFFDAGELLEGIGRDTFHVTRDYSIAVYLRLYAETLFKNYERIIYLDSDMIVLEDLGELFNTNLDGVVLAACHDIAIEHDIKSRSPFAVEYDLGVLGLREENGYFNSGLLVLNLAAMRRDHIQDKLFAALRTVDKPLSPDQDILNMVCAGQVRYLDEGWNAYAWSVEANEADIPMDYAILTTREERLARRKNIKILHYTMKKPWDVDFFGRLDCVYWNYALMSPMFKTIHDQWKKNTGAATCVGKLCHLSFHILRCQLRCKTSAADKRERYRFRLHAYRARLRKLYRILRRGDRYPAATSSEWTEIQGL